jgi:hypothetical protein
MAASADQRIKLSTNAGYLSAAGMELSGLYIEGKPGQGNSHNDRLLRNNRSSATLGTTEGTFMGPGDGLRGVAKWRRQNSTFGLRWEALTPS